MKSIKYYLNKYLYRLDEQHLYEMATIHKNVKLGDDFRSIQIHGIDSGDRQNPHVHIYAYNSKTKFNFEISLVDIVCYDEINLVAMIDTKKHINIKNRSKCSWNNYSNLKRDFEEWLESDDRTVKGEFQNNLDAIIYFYNNESMSVDPNPFLKYLSDRGLKVHNNYRYLFSDKELKEYDV